MSEDATIFSRTLILLPLSVQVMNILFSFIVVILIVGWIKTSLHFLLQICSQSGKCNKARPSLARPLCWVWYRWQSKHRQAIFVNSISSQYRNDITPTNPYTPFLKYLCVLAHQTSKIVQNIPVSPFFPKRKIKIKIVIVELWCKW